MRLIRESKSQKKIKVSQLMRQDFYSDVTSNLNKLSQYLKNSIAINTKLQKNQKNYQGDPKGSNCLQVR